MAAGLQFTTQRGNVALHTTRVSKIVGRNLRNPQTIVPVRSTEE
jgi:hypothetical protein